MRSPTRRRFLLPLAALLVAGGCSLLDEQQRRWVFQPGKATWAGGIAAQGIPDVWIDYTDGEGLPVRLHALWLPQEQADAPLMLYLHGARWDVKSSAGRMRRMHALGFSVLGIDYRGFGDSTEALPSEASTIEDARAAWNWLGRTRPGAARFLYGHSLGTAVAVGLATGLKGAQAPHGLVLEGAFTSIPDVVSTFRYGWLPVGPLITQRLDSLARIAQLKLPLVVVHGSDDNLIPPSLGRALYEHAAGPKRFILAEGGNHHDASARVGGELRDAMAALFDLTLPGSSPRP